MFMARTFIPHPSAIAAGTVARAGGSLHCTWQQPVAHPTLPFPIRRDAMR
jgi:hypothetical protein